MNVSSKKLQHHFSKAADDYDRHALFQHVQTARVADAARMLLPAQARIVDIGCGTGYFAQLVRAAQPQWNILGVDIAAGMCARAASRCQPIQADARALPFADGVADGVVSSLCLQWVDDADSAFREIARILKPGGIAMIASLGAETLSELRACAIAADVTLGLLPMRDPEMDRAAAIQASLEITFFECDVVVEHYGSVHTLLASMRTIGAGNNFVSPMQGMTGIRSWRRMLAEYETRRTAQGIPASWQRVFMVARKPV